jgi:hypothetical protein
MHWAIVALTRMVWAIVTYQDGVDHAGPVDLHCLVWLVVVGEEDEK